MALGKTQQPSVDTSGVELSITDEERATACFQNLPPPAREHLEAGSFYMYKNKYKIFYRIFTNAPDALQRQPESTHTAPLLLLHGFPTSSYDWIEILPLLSPTFPKIIAFDFIGFGYSDKPTDYDYSIIDQADIVQDILTHLQIDTVHILCHDYAVSVGQELLSRWYHRETENSSLPKLLSMCFLNGGLFPETHRPILFQHLLRVPYLGALLCNFITFRLFSRSFSSVFGPQTQPTQQELEEFWQILLYNDGYRNYHKLIRYIDDRIKHRERWVAQGLFYCPPKESSMTIKETTSKVPICLINGPIDPVSGRHMVERFQELNGETKHHVVLLSEQIGHYPQCEAPKEVADAFLQWFSSQKFA